jgi:hypothetical protein
MPPDPPAPVIAPASLPDPQERRGDTTHETWAATAYGSWGDGHDYSRSGKHDPRDCRGCLRAEIARLASTPPALPSPQELPPATLQGLYGLARVERAVAETAEWRGRAEAAEAKLAALPSGWQPIETAPKDGRWMLGWDADYEYFIWRDGPGLITGEDPAPTHWMPLPEPPR